MIINPNQEIGVTVNRSSDIRYYDKTFGNKSFNIKSLVTSHQDHRQTVQKTSSPSLIDEKGQEVEPSRLLISDKE